MLKIFILIIFEGKLKIRWFEQKNEVKINKTGWTKSRFSVESWFGLMTLS